MAPSVAYNGTLTLAFQVKNRKVSMEWYERVLGMSLLYEVEEIGWCELTTPVTGQTVTLGLSEVEAPRVGGPVPTFGVVDIDLARERLEAEGVRFDGKTVEISGMVKLATFFDPDGNTLMFSQSLT